jgi:hypothetical protein
MITGLAGWGVLLLVDANVLIIFFTRLINYLYSLPPTPELTEPGFLAPMPREEKVIIFNLGVFPLTRVTIDVL